MKTKTTNVSRIFAAATAGLVLFGLTSVASAQTCGTPTGYGTITTYDDGYGIDNRRQSRLERRLADVRRDVNRAARELTGMSDYTAKNNLAEARRRLSTARTHIYNAAYRPAARSLDRAATLANETMVIARRLKRVRGEVRTELARTESRFRTVAATARRSGCSVAAGHLRQARMDLDHARRDARHGEWLGARRAVRETNAHLADANSAALAYIQRTKDKRRFDRELAKTDREISKAQRKVADLTRRSAPRQTLAQARTERNRATNLANRGNFGAARSMLKQAKNTAKAAVSQARNAHHRRDDRRFSRRSSDRSRTWVFSSL